jgi:hypothetical protein
MGLQPRVLNVGGLQIYLWICGFSMHLEGQLLPILDHKHTVHENLIGGSNIIWVFPLVIADSERDMPGIEPWAPRLEHQRSDHWATSKSWPGNFGVPPTIALL